MFLPPGTPTRSVREVVERDFNERTGLHPFLNGWELKVQRHRRTVQAVDDSSKDVSALLRTGDWAGRGAEIRLHAALEMQGEMRVAFEVPVPAAHPRRHAADVPAAVELVKPDLDPPLLTGLRAGGGDVDCARLGAGSRTDIQSVCDGGLIGHQRIVPMSEAGREGRTLNVLPMQGYAGLPPQFDVVCSGTGGPK